MDAYQTSHLADAFQSSSTTIHADDVSFGTWNDDLDNLVNWTQDAEDQSNGHGIPAVPSQAMFEHWLSAPNMWEAGPTVSEQEAIAPDAGNSNEENDVLYLQRQIDELKATLSAMAEQGQVATAPEPGIAISAMTSMPPRRSHARTLSTNVRGSFSMNVSGNGTPSFRSGFSTPAEGLESPFDYPDDSPIYSRRSSVQSNISAPGKRGQRIPGGYRCSHCASAFDVPSKLRHHERKHIAKEQRRHGCNECGSRFLYPKDLARHERNVHKADAVDAVAGQESIAQSQGTIIADQRYSRKRHWEQCQAVVRARSRDRRMTNDSSTSSSLATDMPDVTWPEDVAPSIRRDSIIPDIVTEDIDKDTTQTLQSSNGLTAADFSDKAHNQGHNTRRLSRPHEVPTNKMRQSAAAEALAYTDQLGVLTPNATSVVIAKQWLNAIHALLESMPSTANESSVRMAAMRSLDRQLDALQLEGD